MLLAAVVGTAGCTASTAPSPALGLTMSCPAGLAGQSADGRPALVSFALPAVSGGQGTVSVACSPASGAGFPVGTTKVVCTARDTGQHTASCAFPVTVTKVPRLAATNFVAFGDSITEGFEHPCPARLNEPLMAFVPPRQLRPPEVSPIAYPARLQAALASRYTAQLFRVVNEGNGGETVPLGAADITRVLDQDRPEVLLLQEGTNDLISIYFGESPDVAIANVIGGLRTMIRTARARNLPVFLGTLTPRRPDSCRSYAPAYVVPANDQIRTLAASEGATLVDLYQAFGGVAGDLIGPDGLHPNAAGYQRIADTFFSAIQSRLEN